MQVTTSFNTENYYVLPPENLYTLYVPQNKQRNFFLRNTKWLAFITEVASVYCAVETGSLNKMDYISYLKG